MAQPLTLHAHGSGPNPFKIAAALEILQVPYEVKLWQFGDADDGVKGSRFTAINPNGRVPALEDPNTGITSWESGACMNYLLRVYDKQNKLGPRGDGEQARVDFEKWIFFLVSTLGPMTGQAVWFKNFHSPKNEDAYKRYEEQTYRCLMVLDGQLATAESGGKYILGGDSISAVDLHFYPWVSAHGFAGLSMDKYPNVKKWLAGCAEEDGIKRAYEKVAKGQKA